MQLLEEIILPYSSVAILVYTYMLSPVPYKIKKGLIYKGIRKTLAEKFACDKCHAFWAGSIFCCNNLHLYDWWQIPIFGGLTVVLVKILQRFA